MYSEAVIFRHFFAASDTASLKNALSTLHNTTSSFSDNEFAALDFEQEEYTFNRLFVGPEVPLAPPYASVWLNKEKLLMTQETLRVREFLSLLGVQAPTGMPDDYLVLELEAYLMLRELEKMSADKQAVKVALIWLVKQHWQWWLPAFIKTALAAPGLTPGVKIMMKKFEHWSQCEIVSMSMSATSV